ncbi:hypothetical protein Tco_0229828, partial [Tanacetum coccineum]
MSNLPPCVAITPVLSTEEPDNSLSMGDEHLDTILKTESDEVIKSSVEDLVPIPSESEGIFDNMCDVPFCDKNHFDASLLEEFASELALIAPIPPRIVEANLNPKRDIRFIENLKYDNSFPRLPETLKDDSKTVIDSNNDYSSSDDGSPYSKDIDYVNASPPDSELVSLEEVKDFHTKDGEIEDDILHEKLSKINLLIAKIEAI